MQYHVTVTIPETLEPQVRVLDDFETFVSSVTIHALQHLQSQKTWKQQQLAEAAQLMLKDYTEDQTLTYFTVLDGDPFHE